MTNKCAPARTHCHGRMLAESEAADEALASASITGLIETMRGLAFSDSYVAATLLAGAKSLIRGMPNKAPWSALLASMAAEAADGR